MISKKNSKDMNKARGCFLTVLVLFLIIVVVYIFFFSTGRRELAQEDGQQLAYSPIGANAMLFLGIDERDPSGEFRGRTDTIIVYHFGRMGRGDTLIAIPRDTRVNLDGHGYNKINAAYVYGGEEMIKNEIYKLTGLKVSKTMVINFEGFERIIDSFGGVEITVEEPLHDPLSGANFDPGTYLMSGEQALAFARTRSTSMGDLDRV
jgi:polyisoprenyl-teichoic acid--peptidoglycan teichoic acid transferase